MHPKSPNQGFTLIELLVVISIIGLFASIVLASLGTARTKARDARRIADLKNIQTALYLYFDKHNAMPVNQNPGQDWNDTQPNFLHELVDDKFLSAFPKSPTSPTNPYRYYDYGPGNNVGAVLVTNLEAAAPTVTGYPNTCRPWASGQNWCDLDNDTEYCLCLTY